MKRIIAVIISALFAITLFSCDFEESTGGGDVEILGNIISFEDECGAVIGTFSSNVASEKNIALSLNKDYKISVEPIFRGSRDAMFRENNIEFIYDSSVCFIEYLGEENYRPTYKITLSEEGNFTLTVKAGGYSQSITVAATQE